MKIYNNFLDCMETGHDYNRMGREKSIKVPCLVSDTDFKPQFNRYKK
jgi:hypothetical protein